MDKPLIIAASDNEAMAKLAKPGLSAAFDVLPLISKWSLEFQAGKKYGLRSISSVASRALTELTRLAFDGNKEAATSLHNILLWHVCDFDELCQQSEIQNLFGPLARKSTMWPGLLSCDADTLKQNKKLLAALRLGTNSGLNYSSNRRQWTRSTPEVLVALKLYGIINVYREGWLSRNEQQKLMREHWEQMNKRLGRPADYRPKPKPLAVSDKLAEEFRRREQSVNLARRLEPLGRNNYKEWFAAAMPEFTNFYGADFENRKVFARHWKNSAYANEPKARALIRRDVKKQIKQAFRSIAPTRSIV